MATLHLSEKEAGLIDRLQILAIGVQRMFEPSLRDPSAILSPPVALLVLRFFNIFRIDNEPTFSSLIFFHGS